MQEDQVYIMYIVSYLYEYVHMNDGFLLRKDSVYCTTITYDDACRTLIVRVFDVSSLKDSSALSMISLIKQHKNIYGDMYLISL